MKKFAALVALAALAAGCSTTDNANVATTNNNANTATVVNNNGNANTSGVATTNSNANMTATNANTTRRTYNPAITEAEYEKDKARFGTEAKEAGNTIGSGLKDGYLWTKTKGVLAAVDDLRDSTINVDVDNGVITLRGNVATKAQKDAAVKAANSVEGKKSVKDMLEVKADASMMNSNGSNTNAATHNGNANHK